MRKAALARLTELATTHRDVVLAVSDVGEEVVAGFRAAAPERLFVEGISEAHLVGMACGLALEGSVVFVNTIASFLNRRALDQITLGLCLEGANVKLLAQGGGLVYGQHGPTHHATDDIALMRALPGMTVLAPCDTEETRRAIDLAYARPGPVYIRLAKGSGPVISGTAISTGTTLEIGRPVILREPGDTLLLAYGSAVPIALEAARRLPGAGVFSLPVLKPFPTEALVPWLDRVRLVVTVEEHSEIGGLASCICEAMVRHGNRQADFMSFALPDAFARDYGKQEVLLRRYGLDAETVAAKVAARRRDRR